MTTNYYIHSADFACDNVPDYIMPYDVKRIISHNRHTFHKRVFFFSPSERQVYRYDPLMRITELVKGSEIGNSLKFNLVTDESRHDTLYVSDRMLAYTSNMNKIELMKSKGMD